MENQPQVSDVQNPLAGNALCIQEMDSHNLLEQNSRFKPNTAKEKKEQPLSRPSVGTQPSPSLDKE